MEYQHFNGKKIGLFYKWKIVFKYVNEERLYTYKHINIKMGWILNSLFINSMTKCKFFNVSVPQVPNI